jgi:hypothetical protein
MSASFWITDSYSRIRRCDDYDHADSPCRERVLVEIRGGWRIRHGQREGGDWIRTSGLFSSI